MIEYHSAVCLELEEGVSFRDIWISYSKNVYIKGGSRLGGGVGGDSLERQVLSSIDFLTIIFSKNHIPL